jgi:anti-sigma factor RsiW
MRRIERLTWALLDGEISARERAELQWLVATDPEARNAHDAVLACDRGLRRLLARRTAQVAAKLGCSFRQ